MMQEQRQTENLNIETLDIGDLEYSVGPSGSSEAVVGLACFGIAGAILIWKSL